MSLFSFSTGIIGKHGKVFFELTLADTMKAMRANRTLMNLLTRIRQFGDGRIKSHFADCPIMTGKLNWLKACPCGGLDEEFVNSAQDDGMESLVRKLGDRNNTNTTDGFISHFDFGTNNVAAAPTDGGVFLWKARKEVRAVIFSGRTATFKTFLNGSTGTTFQGTVISASSTTVFTLQANQGNLFRIGDQIEVRGGAMPSPQSRKIQNITGINTITLTAALPVQPTGGETIEQQYAEVSLVGTSAATDTQGTGLAFARTNDFTPRTKPNLEGLTAEWNLSIQ